MQITPAHDPNDFKVGERHNLEFINIFTDDGKINEMGGPQFEGMPRFAARTAVIDALKNKVVALLVIFAAISFQLMLPESNEATKYGCLLLFLFSYLNHHIVYT